MVAPPTAATRDVHVMKDIASADSDEREMRAVEWLVAGVALLVALLLAIPQ